MVKQIAPREADRRVYYEQKIQEFPQNRAHYEALQDLEEQSQRKIKSNMPAIVLDLIAPFCTPILKTLPLLGEVTKTTTKWYRGTKLTVATAGPVLELKDDSGYSFCKNVEKPTYCIIENNLVVAARGSVICVKGLRLWYKHPSGAFMPQIDRSIPNQFLEESIRSLCLSGIYSVRDPLSNVSILRKVLPLSINTKKDVIFTSDEHAIQVILALNQKVQLMRGIYNSNFNLMYLCRPIRLMKTLQLEYKEYPQLRRKEDPKELEYQTQMYQNEIRQLTWLTKQRLSMVQFQMPYNELTPGHKKVIDIFYSRRGEAPKTWKALDLPMDTPQDRQRLLKELLQMVQLKQPKATKETLKDDILREGPGDPCPHTMFELYERAIQVVQSSVQEYFATPGYERYCKLCGMELPKPVDILEDEWESFDELRTLIWKSATVALSSLHFKQLVNKKSLISTIIGETYEELTNVQTQLSKMRSKEPFILRQMLKLNVATYVYAALIILCEGSKDVFTFKGGSARAGKPKVGSKAAPQAAPSVPQPSKAPQKSELLSIQTRFNVAFSHLMKLERPMDFSRETIKTMLMSAYKALRNRKNLEGRFGVSEPALPYMLLNDSFYHYVLNFNLIMGNQLTFLNVKELMGRDLKTIEDELKSNSISPYKTVNPGCDSSVMKGPLASECRAFKALLDYLVDFRKHTPQHAETWAPRYALKLREVKLNDLILPIPLELLQKEKQNPNWKIFWTRPVAEGSRVDQVFLNNRFVGKPNYAFFYCQSGQKHKFRLEGPNLADLRCTLCGLSLKELGSIPSAKVEKSVLLVDSKRSLFDFFENRCPVVVPKSHRDFGTRGTLGHKEGSFHDFKDGRCIKCGLQTKWTTFMDSAEANEYYRKYIDLLEEYRTNKMTVTTQPLHELDTRLRSAQLTSGPHSPSARSLANDKRASKMNHSEQGPLSQNRAAILGRLAAESGRRQDTNIETYTNNFYELARLSKLSFNQLINLGLSEGFRYSEILKDKVNPHGKISDETILYRNQRLLSHLLWIVRYCLQLRDPDVQLTLDEKVKKIISKDMLNAFPKICKYNPLQLPAKAKMDYLLFSISSILIEVSKLTKGKEFTLHLLGEIIQSEKLLAKPEPLNVKVDKEDRLLEAEYLPDALPYDELVNENRLPEVIRSEGSEDFFDVQEHLDVDYDMGDDENLYKGLD